MRLISVVMGEDSTDKRSSDTLAMLDYGFNMYSINKVVDKNKSIGNKDVSMGEKEKVNIQVLNDITVLNNNQKNKRNITYDISINEIKAPVKIGDVVGKIMVYEDGKYLMSENVTVMENIDKANIFKVILRNIRDIIGIKV